MKAVPASNVRLLSLPANGTAEFMTDVDATTNRDGDLELFWGTFGDRKPKEQVWHARLASDWARWGAVTRIDGVQSGPRVAECDSELQLIAYRGGPDRLSHLWSDRRTGVWTIRGGALRVSDREQSYDVLAVDSLLIVAFLGYRQTDPEMPFSRMPVVLAVAEIPPRGPTVYHDLATFPHIDLSLRARPHLTLWRGEVHLVCSFGGAEPQFRALHAYRASGSDTWSSVTDLGSPGTRWSPDLAIAATHDRLFVFFHGSPLEAVESVDGRHWSPVVRLAEARAWTSSETGRGISASADSDAVIVAWTDRGIGSSRVPPVVIDNPSLRQDVLAMASTVHPATLAGLAASPLLRITPATGFLGGVVTSTGRGWHRVAWIRNGFPPGGPPEIGAARVPITPN